MQVGVVSKLWRYPVKSMLGEECREVELQARGFDGDRLFAVQDAQAQFGVYAEVVKPGRVAAGDPVVLA